MRKPLKAACVVSAFFALFCADVCAAPNAHIKHNFKEKTAVKEARETECEDKIVPDFEMLFGKIVRIQDGTATVKIISRIPEAQIEPVFFACDVRSMPVAQLQSLHTGYKNCFLFKIERGTASVEDDVIVRYYKTVKIPLPDNKTPPPETPEKKPLKRVK